MTTPASPDKTQRANPVLWMVIALPVIAVVASTASYFLAATRGDRELPADYHWEGQAFDRDEARFALARSQGLTAQVQVDAAAGRCEVTLPAAAGAQLHLDLTHPTETASDRHVVLAREGDSARYGAACAPLAAAHWWVQVADAGGTWLLRGRVQGALAEPALLVPPAGGATAAALPPPGPASKAP